jgi:hypothetical protein
MDVRVDHNTFLGGNGGLESVVINWRLGTSGFAFWLGCGFRGLFLGLGFSINIDIANRGGDLSTTFSSTPK